MKNKRFAIKVLYCICVIFIVCFCLITATACNNKIRFSKEIFITDFSETYRISIKVSVKNHLNLPEPALSFEYGKGMDKLLEDINDSPSGCSARKDNNVILVDCYDNDRIYSCIIYPSGVKNEYIIHSLSYNLGEWAENRAIFFPAYTLDREINGLNDAEATTYDCSMNIDDLKNYYTQRGYYAEISDNALRVVCLIRYPSAFEYQDKAISWTVVYEDTNTIRFKDVTNEYKL